MKGGPNGVTNAAAYNQNEQNDRKEKTIFPLSNKTRQVLAKLAFCSFTFFVRLLDYSILLKARHDELIHELINVNTHELKW